jgi:hypothetical protein
MWLVTGARHCFDVPVLGAALSRGSDRRFARRFTTSLRDLHDALDGTELAGRYWVWAGMLLGWAREGQLLAHDRDADFALRPDAVPALLEAVPSLRRAGFHPLQMYRNNDGKVTEITFYRGTARIEFFVMEPIDGMLRYYVYGYPPDNLIEVEARVSDQALVPFDFLGRTWLRPADHERELEEMYGDWRTPRREWDYLHDDHAAVSRRPWFNRDTSWSE